jgi:signal transduction histidine kinase
MRDLTMKQNRSGELRQTQKIELIRDLASDVVDDFNNILTIIIGACTLLEMNGGDNPEQMQYVDRIRSNADRAAQLAQFLLESSGNPRILPTHENLAEVIRETLCSLTRIIGNHLDISVQLPEQALMVMIDRRQIETFFMNLLINFRSVTTMSGVLSIVMSRVGNYGDLLELAGYEEGDYAMVVISEASAGMDRDTLRSIFKPYSSTRMLPGEDGLDISVYHVVINQHGGVVHARSKPGHGTTLKIFLPLCDQDERIISEYSGG